MTEKLKSDLKTKGVEYVFCSFVELTGAPKAKLVPVSHIEEFAQDGAGFAGFACGDVGQGPHHPDICSVPDLGSLTVLPWRKNTAWVTGNLYVEGKPWPMCPRTALMRQLELAKKQGYVVNIGIEPEFMLLKKNTAGEYLPWDEFDTLVKPCYDLRALHRNLDVMTSLLGFMQELGWDPYANDHEDANCQFELNWTFSDALTTADRYTFFKWMVRTVAEQHGLLATFMPKPFGNLTGNGAHVHLSLADVSGKNLFLDESADRGLSQLGRWFMAGVLHHARALSALVAPIVNSYKRLVPGFEAPTLLAYSARNRSASIRIPWVSSPKARRIEVRFPDSLANPYFAFAAMMLAGLDGIQNKIHPGDPADKDLYDLEPEEAKHIPTVCHSLDMALEHLDNDREFLTRGGVFTNDVIDAYMALKLQEITRFRMATHPVELDMYYSA